MLPFMTERIVFHADVSGFHLLTPFLAYSADHLPYARHYIGYNSARTVRYM